MERVQKFLAAVARITTPQYLAAGRNYLNFFAGIAATAGVINVAKSQWLIDNFVNIGTAVGALAVALSALIVAITPLVAANTASPASQLTSVMKNQDIQLPDGPIITTPEIANAVPSPKVISG